MNLFGWIQHSLHTMHAFKQTSILEIKMKHLKVALWFKCIQPFSVITFHWNSADSNLVSWKYVPLCTLCATPFYVSYCTFRRSFKEKCPLSVAKTQVKYVNTGKFLLCRYRYILLCFYYVASESIVAFPNSNIRGLSLKVNALSCWKYALHQTQP